MAKKAKVLEHHHIQRHRVTFACLRAIAKIPNARVAEATGLCAATIRKLRRPVNDGGTIYPRLHTVASIGQAFGYELKMVERSEAAVAKARAEYDRQEQRPAQPPETSPTPMN